VIYFHGKQRCLTCKAIEKNAKEVVNNQFANELENGTVVFNIVDISTPEGEQIADRYEVTWSSLFINKWKDGEETRNNMTEGMGKGPALALLLSGPSLSLPNMLVIHSMIGTKKTVLYVTLVIIMATISGWLYGYFF